MDKPTIHYVSDALCGWCYGFTPVLMQFQQKNKDSYNFNVINGGMLTGERIQPVSTVANYIKDASKRVSEVTGVEFSNFYFSEIIDKGTYMQNSLPPAVAFAILRDLAPDKMLTFAHAIQKAIFTEGKDLNDADTYVPMAAELGLDRDDFMERFASEHYKQQVENEFNVVSQWGIQGFPVVIMQKGDKMAMVCQGYQPLNNLEEIVGKIAEMDFENLPKQEQ